MTRPDRLSTAAEARLDAHSLVGSYFHADQRRKWQGCVVAEPHPGYYLVELFSWLAGESTEQHLVHIGDMTSWSFYDTAAWMANSADVRRQEWEAEVDPA